MRVLSVLIILSSVFSNSIAQDRLYTIKNDVWQKNDSATYFVVLKNDKNCLRCFTELAQFLADTFKGNEVVFASLSQADSSVFARKQEAIAVNKLMPSVSLVLFEYNGARTQALFKKNKVDITPCLIVMKGGKQFYFGYDQLYEGSAINKAIVQKINKQIAGAN